MAGPGLPAVRSGVRGTESAWGCRLDLGPLRHAAWGLGRQLGPRASCRVTARGDFGPGVSLGSPAPAAPRLRRWCGDHGEGHRGTVVTWSPGICTLKRLVWGTGGRCAGPTRRLYSLLLGRRPPSTAFWGPMWQPGPEGRVRDAGPLSPAPSGGRQQRWSLPRRAVEMEGHHTCPALGRARRGGRSGELMTPPPFGLHRSVSRSPTRR